MKFVFIAFLFAAAVGLCTLFAKHGFRVSVESSLQSQAEEALENAGYDDVSVSFDHLHATVEGEVKAAPDREKVISLLREEVNGGYFPDADESSLIVKPTVAPFVSVIKTAGSKSVSLKGSLAIDEEAGKVLIGTKLHALPEVDSVDNSIELDSTRLPFPRAAEFSSIASQLIEQSPDAEITFKNGVLILKGEVSNDGIKDTLLDLASQLEPGNLVDELTVAAPIALKNPTEVKITRNRFGIVLSGILSDEEARETLLNVFTSYNPSLRITDRIETSLSYAPAPWESHSAELVPALLGSMMGELTAEFTGESVRINGTLPSEAARDELLRKFATLQSEVPSLAVLTDVVYADSSVSDLPPMQWIARHEGELLTIDGIVSSDQFIGILEEALQKNHPEVAIKNTLEVAEGIPDGQWLSRLPDFFIECFDRSDEFSLEFTKGRLLLEGVVETNADLAVIQNMVTNSFPSGTSVENLLTSAENPFPQPTLLPEVRTRLSETFRSSLIYFDSGSEIVNEDGREKVEILAAAIQEAGPNLELIITGVSDNVGSASSNRALSLRRANSVLAALVARGLNKDNFTTESALEDVSGVSRSQRWKSRRVEISLADEADATVSEEADER